MADFDVIRDRTLLFFLDHLMGKGQPRSLHDLSCQFGAKGFTKEMRQIAGGSQAGLKKFLSQFPSLFTIDGDNVLITPLTSQQNGFSSRDYTRETIEFFTDKLHTYGVAEVPLKSLFGHRSQASSEVRHVSGQNVSEFRAFLETHPSVFVVRDNYVVLKSVLDQLEQDGSNAESLKRMPEETTLDPYLMQRLVNELEETLFALSEKYSDKVSIDFLFNAIQSKESLLPWDNFVKVPTDLITFLHMNSRIFLVQSNTVSLTPERVQLLKEKRSTPTNHLETVPATNAANHESSQVASSRPSHTSTPLSDSVQSSSSSLSKNRSTPVLTFKERIRSQIIKIVSQQNKPPDSRNYNSNSIQEDISPNADSPYDSLDLQQLRPKIVVKNKECEMIVEDIMNNCTEVAFDLEGISLGPTGEVTLVQIAYVYSRDIKEPLRNQSPHIVYFDVFLNPNLIDSGLRRLLESEKIVKVSHDVRTNSVSLYHKFNITLRSVFDTQVAHLVLQQQSTGKPAYKPTKYISVFTLSTLHGGPNLNPKLKDKLHKHTRKDYKFWKNRPLTDEMLQFAMIDIFAVMTVYHTMRGQIRAEYEPLFEQLVYESIFAYIHSDQIKQIKRQRKFEMELTDLKLKLFNNDKKKIVLSNREIRLLRYIDLTDEIRNKIEGPQNVAKKLKMFESRRRNEQDLGESANGDQETNGHNGSNGHSESRVEIKLADLTDSDLDEDEEEEEVDTTEESINSSIKSSLSNDNLLKPSSGTTRCHCECHQNGSKVENRAKWEPSSTTNTTSSISQCDISTQTLSTGDIVITKIYFNDGTEQNDCSQI